MRGKLKLVLAIVVTAAVAALGTWLAVGRAGGGSPPPPEPVDVALDPFTTNLRDGRVVQVSLVLRVAGAEAAEALENEHGADVRHQVYRVLRGMTAADLAGTAGMDRLRQAIWQALAAPAAPAAENETGSAGGGAQAPGAGAGSSGTGAGEAAGASGGGTGGAGLGLPVLEVLITDLIVQ